MLYLRTLLVLTCLVFTVFLLPDASSVQAISPNIIISQVYGGGGNSGATLRNDFIELFNRGSQPVNVTGWTVQYASAAGSSWDSTVLSGTIQPGRYYLVQEFQGAGGIENLPAPDATGGINLNATTGKVALVNNSTLLIGTCPAGSQIVDFVGYGSSANCSEGFPTSNLNNTTAAIRASGGCTDTDNNSSNFNTGSPNPRNSSTPANPCSGPPPPDPEIIRIHTIQGSGSTSTLAGQMVATEGIVTAIKSNGFFIQEPDATIDTNPATSEGIFIFTSGAPPPSVVKGNRLRITGMVTEFKASSAPPNSPPLTEITSPTISSISIGNPLPAPIIVPELSSAGGIEQLERFEGMRVTISHLRTTSSTQSDGVLYGAFASTARPLREPGISVLENLPTGAPAGVPRFDANPELLRIDTNGQAGAQIVDVTSQVSWFSLTGVLDSSFGQYTLLRDSNSGLPSTDNLTPTPITQADPDEFTVATANLERFFDTEDDPSKGDTVLSDVEFGIKLGKTGRAFVNILRQPDIIAVQEVENLTTLQSIATRINTEAGASNPQYQAFLNEGNDPGGIDVGFLVKSSRVNVLEVTQLGAGERFADPTDGSQDLIFDRPPLLMRAAIRMPNNQFFEITVINNHLRSLLEIEDEEEGPRVRAKRKAQAEFLANLVQTLQTGNPDIRLIVLGDFNAFEFNDGYVDVIGTIKGMPAPADQVVLASSDLVNPNLVNLTDFEIPSLRYTFIHNGSLQTLDQILVTDSLARRSSFFDYGRLNTDFPDSARALPSIPDRVSDHDWPVAYFTFEPSGPQIDSLTVSKKKLIVEGEGFEQGAKILVNGKEQKTKFESSTGLIGKKAGKKIKAGDKVQVANPGNVLSPEVTYQP